MGPFLSLGKSICICKISIRHRDWLGKQFKYSCWSRGHSSVVIMLIWGSWDTTNYHQQQRADFCSWNETASSSVCSLNLICKLSNKFYTKNYVQKDQPLINNNKNTLSQPFKNLKRWSQQIWGHPELLNATLSQNAKD